LCNSIVGGEKFRVGSSLDVETTEVQSLKFGWTYLGNTVKLLVQDTPPWLEYQKDRYFETLRRTCHNADVLLYCIAYDVLDLQLVANDNKILGELKSSVFQESTMRHVVIVLTRANRVNPRISAEESLQTTVEKLKQKLKPSFPDPSIVPVIPAGSPKGAFLERDTPQLPWLHRLLHEILKQVNELNLFDSLIQSHTLTSPRKV